MLAFSLVDREDIYFSLKVWSIIRRHEGWITKKNGFGNKVEAMLMIYTHVMRLTERDTPLQRLDAYIRSLAVDILKAYPNQSKYETQMEESEVDRCVSKDIEDFSSDIYLDELRQGVEFLFCEYPEEMDRIRESLAILEEGGTPESIKFKDDKFRGKFLTLVKVWGYDTVVKIILSVSPDLAVYAGKSNVLQLNLVGEDKPDIDSLVSERPVRFEGRNVYVEPDLTMSEPIGRDDWTTDFRSVFAIEVFPYVDYVFERVALEDASLIHTPERRGRLSTPSGVRMRKVLFDEYLDYCRKDLIYTVLSELNCYLVATNEDYIFVSGDKIDGVRALSVKVERKRNLLLRVERIK